MGIDTNEPCLDILKDTILQEPSPLLMLNIVIRKVRDECHCNVCVWGEYNSLIRQLAQERIQASGEEEAPKKTASN